MIENAKIIQLSNQHIAEISHIENECFAVPWSQDSIKESMEHNTLFFGAEIDSKIVGYCGLQNISGDGYITNIAVLEEFRTNGIATAILQTVIDYFITNGLNFITLEVRKSNKTAINLYKKFGFENVGNRKNFYRLPTEDAIIMTRYQK